MGIINRLSTVGRACVSVGKDYTFRARDPMRKFNSLKRNCSELTLKIISGKELSESDLRRAKRRFNLSFREIEQVRFSLGFQMKDILEESENQLDIIEAESEKAERIAMAIEDDNSAAVELIDVLLESFLDRIVAAADAEAKAVRKSKCWAVASMVASVASSIGLGIVANIL